MFPFRLFRSDPDAIVAVRLHAAALAQARRPEFFAVWGVPDSLDGRFETLCLHVFLVVRRLQSDAGGRTLARRVLEATVDDLDRTLREMGVGDLGVGRRVKAMGEGLMGRLVAYDAALAAPDDAALEATLRRNLWGTLGAPAEPSAAARAAVATYVRRAAAALAGQGLASLCAEGPAFPPVAGTEP